MSTLNLLLAALILLAVYFLAVRPVLRVYLKFRGMRVITCPETHASAAVEVDARHAAISAALGKPCIRLRDCSRWPERRDCGQECLRQIEVAPSDCLLRTILTRWYAGKVCALCGKTIGEIDWIGHKPALMDASQRTFEWHEFDPEEIPEVLATYTPVCWNCHIAETFRRQFPDLVVNRPERQ
jgi:hypothetical protein